MAVTDPAQATPSGARALYSRRSTGLVRELSTFDAFALCSGAIAIPIGAAQAFLWAPALFPGVDMRWSFAVAAVMAFFFGLVYIYFTQMMPRSGGDYVWVSRVLHPSVGFTVSVVLTFVPLSWTALNTGVMPTMFLPGLADLTGHHGFTLTHGQQMLIGTGVTLAVGLLVILGMRLAARLATVLFGVVAAGTLLWVVLMLVRSHGSFVSAFNADSPMKYQQVIDTARSKGFDPSPDLKSTLLGVIYGFQFFVGFQWVAYFAGEVRGAQRVAKRAILGVWATTAVVYIVAAAAMYHVFGFRFLSSAVYLFSDHPEAYKATAAPYISSLSQYLTGSTVLQWAIPITFLCSIPWITISCFLVGTRNLLAWSFDRIVPERLSSVSDRIIEVILWATVYTAFWAWLVNWIAVMALAFLIVCVAAAVLPWRRPDLYERAPAAIRGRWLGVPKLVVAGVLGAIAEACLIAIAFSTPSIGGEVTMRSLIYAFAIPVAGFAVYWISRGVRRAQGIDLTRTFAEIPPE
jgi:basic amino acid/polyamine antiporter, APA family